MEDFMVIGVIDLELDNQIISKNKVQYSVIQGDEILDTLILGSSQFQTQEQAAGQAPSSSALEQERGSNEPMPTSSDHLNKKTKVALYG